MRNGALTLPEHGAKVGDAHFRDAKRGKDLYAGGVAKDRKEIRHIGNDLILRQIIFDHPFIAFTQAERGFLRLRIHIFNSIRHIKNRQRRSLATLDEV